MAKFTSGDFANQGAVTATQTAINTLVFQQVQSGTGIFDKVAWILHRIELFVSAANLNELTTAADILMVAMTVSDNITSLQLNDPNVVTLFDLVEIIHGTPANAETIYQPFHRDFTNLPNNGLLIIPNPLYLGITTAGFAAVAAVMCRYFYSQIELSDADYLSLIQSRRLVS